MNRRDFLATSAASGAALATPSLLWACDAPASPPTLKTGRFRLDFAPHFGMFHHHAGGKLLDQIKFMADEGFGSLEDSALINRPPHVQDAIRRELDEHGMRFGAFTASADFGNPTFASGRKEDRRRVLDDVRLAVEFARRMNARWCTVVPGKWDRRLSATTQSAQAIDTLRAGVEICEPAGLVLLLEPFHRGAGRPKLFLHNIDQAVRICRAVNSPSCKILFDICHQFSTVDDSATDVLRGRMDGAWEHIGYFQIGDSPGRKEPGAGTIDFGSLFSHIEQKGFTGILGMDHGNSRPGRDGERAVLNAYAQHDGVGASHA